jgi:hypothetical protein
LDIIKRYGNRGKNIVNLYCEGYFENFLKPIFEELNRQTKSPTEASSKFKEIYEFVIKESPVAIFVNKAMGQDEVKALISAKIERNAKYGIKYFNIHGIGHENCMKIKKAIEAIEAGRGTPINKETHETNNIVNVTIYLESLASKLAIEIAQPCPYDGVITQQHQYRLASVDKGVRLCTIITQFSDKC